MNDDYGCRGLLQYALTSKFTLKKGGNHERIKILSTDFDNSNNDFGT